MAVRIEIASQLFPRCTADDLESIAQSAFVTDAMARGDLIGADVREVSEKAFEDWARMDQGEKSVWRDIVLNVYHLLAMKAGCTISSIKEPE